MGDNKCEHCMARLRPFKKTTDWSMRKLHKVCFEQINAHANLQYFTKLMLQRNQDMVELRLRLFSK